MRQPCTKDETFPFGPGVRNLHGDGSLSLLRSLQSDERHVLGTACVLSFGQIPQREYLRLRTLATGTLARGLVSFSLKNQISRRRLMSPYPSRENGP